MDESRLLLACGEAFILSFVLTPIIRDVFRAYNVVDRPGRRKVHAYPIPRVGGVPIAVAYLFGLLSLRGPGSVFPVHWLQTILSGALVIFLTGLIDDFYNLQPRVKLLGQIVAATVAYLNGLSIDRFAGVDLPVWLSLPITIFWLLLTSNALNLIDGLDGLCSGVSFWATLAYFAVAITNDNLALAFTALPLAGALLGFLFFNFNPATVFLGDSGALLIGFLLGCYGILWTGHDVTLRGVAVPLLALCVPMLDVGLAIVRRRLAGKPIFGADRGHIHHRLLDRGLTVRRSAMAIYAAGITGGLAGLLLTWPGATGPLRAVVIAGVIMAAVGGIRALRYPEFEVAVSLLMRGEYRRVFTAKLRVARLAQDLERARTRDEWWRLLVAAGREWHWIRLRWTGEGGPREEALEADRQPAWSFVIRLGEGESVEVFGDALTPGPDPDMPGLAGILGRTYRNGARMWKQPAIS